MFRPLLAAIAAAMLLTLPATATAYQAEQSGPINAPGAVLVVHGGAWLGNVPGQVAEARPYAERFHATNLTLNVDYRSGAQGAQDILEQFDALQATDPTRPVCVIGYSVGGFWALWLAQHRDVACTIAEAAPTNLLTISPYLAPYASQAFGYNAQTLADWSPALHTADTHGRVLLVNAENDNLITPDQPRHIIDGVPGSQLIMLPAGDRSLYHVHSPVDGAALRQAIDIERAFVRDSQGSWRAAHAAPAPAQPPTTATLPTAPAATSKPADTRTRKPAKKPTSRSANRPAKKSTSRSADQSSSRPADK